MRYILITLLGLFLFACSDDKDTMSLEDQEKEIFDAILGRWQFSRASNTADFTNLINIEQSDCNRESYVEFHSNYSANNRYCTKSNIVIKDEGSFEIGFDDSDMPFIYLKNVALTYGEHGYLGAHPIYQYAKNTFVFYHYDYKEKIYTYLEYKRIPIPEK